MLTYADACYRCCDLYAGQGKDEGQDFISRAGEYFRYAYADVC